MVRIARICKGREQPVRELLKRDYMTGVSKSCGLFVCGFSLGLQQP